MNEIRGVYKITNKKNGLVYIGVSQNCCDRKKQHLWKLRRGNHYNNRLQEDFNKYGENNFKFNIIYEANIDENLNDLEQDFINNYKSNYKTYGYNNNKGGGYHDYEFKKNNYDDSLSCFLEIYEYTDLLTILSLLSSGVDFEQLEQNLRLLYMRDVLKRANQLLEVYEMEHSQYEDKYKHRRTKEPEEVVVNVHMTLDEFMNLGGDINEL